MKRTSVRNAMMYCTLGIGALFAAMTIFPQLILAGAKGWLPIELPPAVWIHFPDAAFENSADKSKSASDRIAVPTTEFSHGNPSAEEQYSLEMMNRARANPTEEGVRLVDNNDANVQFALQFFNISKDLVKNQFASYPARPPLAFNNECLVAAEIHSEDMRQNDFQGHTGSDGSQFFERLERQGYTGTFLGENVAASARSLFHGHAGFNIDWGAQNQQTLGHRQNIMNFRATHVFTEAGIGIVHDNDPGTGVGPLIITHEFGFRGRFYITGIVYEDRNGNEFYDVGEGLAGVDVVPNDGDFFAVTSESGGYAIPLNGLGTISSVTASGGDLTEPIVKTIQIAAGFPTQNYKLDFTTDEETLVPAVPTLLMPADGSEIEQNFITLQWEAAANAEMYHVQAATDENFNSIAFEDENLTATSYDLTGLQANMTYYWRVRSAGLGMVSDWSETWSLRYAIPAPEGTVISEPANEAVDQPVNPLFVWQEVANAEIYRLQIATDRNYNNTVVNQELDPADGTQYRLPNALDALTEYWWSVRAENSSGEGPWSETRSFTTTDATSVPELPLAVRQSIRVAPNPVASVANISFVLERHADVTLNIVDMLGRSVAVLVSDRELEAGPHSFDWNTAGLPNGSYRLRLQVDEAASTAVILVNR